ncbi:hypothetical protein TRIATDRAFT_306412 [Trichoderma atroviride IMI 206040]|uniref:Uncharacterized protein n=1 Tax=Hypocrea atroviridis (strain ATCC 20476 / IMI 206040) TaxID=452589 RepID=G9NNQ4_HYPAI|nr:uncharacterized protein TRIATDRAFT_306412 [Trichoderma atroviride IMI 206040]EHK47695.1 hypothetical protein TRIATDRAFT_306412 [Trichoderma atroviride IMI 206040]
MASPLAVIPPIMMSPVVPKPPKLTFADVTVPSDYPYDLAFGTPDYQDTMAVLNAFYSQDTRMIADDRQDMAEIIQNGKYLRTVSAAKSVSSHCLYRKAQKKSFALESVSWANFVILNALYGPKIPPKYIEVVKKKFGMRVVEDYSEEYFQLYPKASHYLPTSADGETSKANSTPTTNKRSRETAEDQISASVAAAENTPIQLSIAVDRPTQPCVRKRIRVGESPVSVTNAPPTLLPCGNLEASSPTEEASSTAYSFDEIFRENRSVGSNLFVRQDGPQRLVENTDTSKTLPGRRSAPQRLFDNCAVPRAPSQNALKSEAKKPNQALAWDVKHLFERMKSTNSTTSSTSADTRNEEKTPTNQSSSANSSVRSSAKDKTSSNLDEGVAKSVSDMKLLLEKDSFRLDSKIDKLQKAIDNSISENGKLVQAELKAVVQKTASNMAKHQAQIKAVVQTALDNAAKKEAENAAILEDIQTYMAAILKRLEEK